MDDTPKAEGNSTRKKGKMYWKFATLEGWQAKKESSGAAGPKTDEAAKIRLQKKRQTTLSMGQTYPTAECLAQIDRLLRLSRDHCYANS